MNPFFERVSIGNGLNFLTMKYQFMFKSLHKNISQVKGPKIMLSFGRAFGLDSKDWSFFKGNLLLISIIMG